MIRKKWWETKAIEKSSKWCVIRVEGGDLQFDIGGRILQQLSPDVYKPCHISNLPTGSNLVNKNLTKHEAQALCKLLNLEGELK